MKWLFVRGLLCSVAFLWVACGSDEKNDPLDEVSGFCAEWGERACSEIAIRRCSSGSEEECQSAQMDFCLDLVPARLYNKEGAKDCLAAVQEAYDDAELDGEERATVESLGGDCQAVLSGDGELDDECTKDTECDVANDLVCVSRLDEESGTCQVPVEVGGGRGCSRADQVCEADFYCDEKRDCIEKQEVDDECTLAVPCKDNLNCAAPEDSGVGVCTEKLGAGDECEWDEECATGICRGINSMICAHVIVLDLDQPICEHFR
jgi:hypothetical protein